MLRPKVVIKNTADLNKHHQTDCYVTSTNKHKFSCLNKACLKHSWICMDHAAHSKEFDTKNQQISLSHVLDQPLTAYPATAGSRYLPSSHTKHPA